jgi:peptidoglycan hydrolase-like protein with peptidoglycan-binding domain
MSGLNQTASALNALNSVGSSSNFPSTDSFSYAWSHDLQIGSPYSADVRELQTTLTKEGVYSGEITGGFYNQTYTAVKAFQQKYGINATGYVGAITRAKLNALY